MAFHGCTALTLLLILASSIPPFTIASNSAAAFVQSAIYSNKIALFSKSYCMYSMRAKNVFSQLHEKPFVVELDKRGDGAQIQNALFDLVGQYTVPQVFVNGKHVGGSDDTLSALASGELKKLLESS
ncbi:glutaredoxin family protein [Wolffia australiana]